ncbi:MAG: glycoside hydrolase family 3 N-terminal domain-containing protein [Cyclobacteriaceae bacterium]
MQKFIFKPVLLTQFFMVVIIFFGYNSYCQVNNQVIYTDADYPVNERIEDLLARMTIEEKVAQMRMFHENRGISIDDNGNLLLNAEVVQRLQFGIGGIKNPGEHLSPAIAAKLNNQLQRYIIENNRLGIPSFFVTESYNGVDASGCTSFARPINMASTWNLDLIEKAYDQIGREARARGLHMTHSPVADIVRDPRFGRMSESFGEDTYLVTEMVVSAVRGLQGNTEGLRNTHIGAVTKHFAGYAQVAGGLNFASIEILPPFKAAVQRANTLGIMPSHGDINGVASHANPELLTNLLRKKWGFEGYVVSDANDVARLAFFMNIAETQQEAALKGLIAGVDVDLYSDEAYALLPTMVKENPNIEKYIDQAVARVLRTKFILGLFDKPFVDETEVDQITRNQKTLDLSHKVDVESITLLKNEGSLLPLASSKQRKIALIGPLLDTKTKSYFEEIAGNRAVFLEERGFSLTDGNSSVPKLTSVAETRKGIQKIKETAKKSDVIFLFIGGDEFTAKEAFFNHALGDRDNIDPVGEQNELLLELKKLAKPIVVILKHRRTLSINILDANAHAILSCWDLSEQGDKAIAKIIFGDVVPSGKLPVTVPRSIGQLPFHYSQKEINYKKDYLFSDASPLYPFGFGLSYTSFEYSNLQLSDSIVNLNNIELQVSIEVMNSGMFKAKEVVQFYLKDVVGSVIRPRMELKGFSKIELDPGEKQTVIFTIKPVVLEFTGIDMERVVEPGEFRVMVGASSADYLTKTFRIISTNSQ